MSRIRISVVAAATWLAAGTAGQTVINGGRQIVGNWDAANAQSTRPAKMGTTLPASCSAGEVFFKTDASAGQNLYLCATANTWTQIAGGGGGGAVSSVFGRAGAVSAQTGDYTAAQVGAIATGGAYADLSASGKIGNSSGTVAAGNDERFADARTPTAHATSHKDAGTDEVATATPAANAIPKAGAAGTLASGWLPAPGGSTLGGVNAKDCTGTGHVLKINTDGTVTCSADSAGSKPPMEYYTAANATISSGYAYGGPWIAPASNSVATNTYNGNPLKRISFNFLDSGTLGIYFEFWLPSDWDGSTITPTLAWHETACTTGQTVLWDVSMACWTGNQATGTGPTFGSVLETTYTKPAGMAADAERYTNISLTSTYIPANCAANSKAMLFIQRNNADTCTGNVQLTGIKMRINRQ